MKARAGRRAGREQGVPGLRSLTQPHDLVCGAGPPNRNVLIHDMEICQQPTLGR